MTICIGYGLSDWIRREAERTGMTEAMVMTMSTRFPVPTSSRLADAEPDMVKPMPGIVNRPQLETIKRDGAICVFLAIVTAVIYLFLTLASLQL